MSGRYCQCPNHIRYGREHSLGGHLGPCKGCCFAKDRNDVELTKIAELKKQNQPPPASRPEPSKPEDEMEKILITLEANLHKGLGAHFEAKAQLLAWRDSGIAEARRDEILIADDNISPAYAMNRLAELKPEPLNKEDA